jgi:hypothetical protein
MRHVLAVSLRSPDPAAISALGALQRFMVQDCPSRILRYDLWEFETPGEIDRNRIMETVSGYPDIINPNKQRASFLDGDLPDLQGDGTLWVGVRVEDVSSAASANWTAILSRSGLAVDSVRLGVLWMLGYQPGTLSDDAVRMSANIATAVDRNHGLLANPVSQRAFVIGPGGPVTGSGR